jgi:curved DNA-binding protein
MDYVDYYKTLGVERGTSQEDISKAYKRLAREYHPDLNKAEGAERRFKEINEAYEVLKDPEKRERYDSLGANWKHGARFDPPPGFGGGFGGNGVHYEFRQDSHDFSDFFGQMFGFGSATHQARRGPSFEQMFGARPPSRGRDIESTLLVTLEDVYHGRKRTVELSMGGRQRKYDLTIPATIRHGEKMRLAGQGAPGVGGKKGDLYLTIEIEPHSSFKVEGADLVTTVSVPAWDAALGGSVTVETFDGDVRLKIPAGISCGQRLRLRGKGLRKDASTRANLFAEIKIVVPKTLSDEQRELFEKLRALE